MVNTRTDAELAAAVQAAVDAMLPQIREQVREEYRTGAVPSGSNPPPVTIHTWLERFNKQKPRSFEKAVAPVDAENWISHMEKIFDVMDCNEAFKTRLAVYKFEGDALAWWKAYKQAKGGDAWVLTLRILVLDATKGTEFQSHALVIESGFPAVQAGHLQQDCNKKKHWCRFVWPLLTRSQTHQEAVSLHLLRISPTILHVPSLVHYLYTGNVQCLFYFDTGAHIRDIYQVASCHLLDTYILDHFCAKIRSVNALPLDMVKLNIILVPYDRKDAVKVFLGYHSDTTSDVSSIHDQPNVSDLPGRIPEELQEYHPPIAMLSLTLSLFSEAEPISKAP
ncbi:hypothetical protein Tco_0299125 [Tanacetum coccineum]